MTLDFMLGEALRLSPEHEQDTAVMKLLHTLTSQSQEEPSAKYVALLVRCVHEWLCRAKQLDDPGVASTSA